MLHKVLKSYPPKSVSSLSLKGAWDMILEPPMFPNLLNNYEANKNVFVLSTPKFPVVTHKYPSSSGRWVLEESMQALDFLIEEKKNEAKAAPKKKAHVPKKYIEPLVENFRRTKKGDRLVQQEVRLLLELQNKHFPAKPMLSPDGGTVRYTVEKVAHSVPMQDLSAKIGSFFSSFFQEIRNKQSYGVKVQSWLQEVLGT